MPWESLEMFLQFPIDIISRMLLLMLQPEIYRNPSLGWQKHPFFLQRFSQFQIFCCGFIAPFNNMRNLNECVFAAVVRQRTLKNRNKQNGSNSTNHSWQTWPFDAPEVNFCFLRGPPRRLTVAKTLNQYKNVSWGWISEFVCYWKPQ